MKNNMPKTTLDIGGNYMKRLITFALVLMMIVSFAACGEQPATAMNEGTDASQVSTQATSNDSVLTTLPTDSEPDSSTTTPTSSESDSTADAQTETGLPDGYKLDVEQTGEKSGIVRLTDPNLQEAYSTSDASVEDKQTLYAWTVTLGDTYEIYLGLYNGVFTDVETMPLEEMAYSLRHSNDRSIELSRPFFYVDGKTLVWEIDLSDADDFAWSDVNDYKVTIIDAPNNVKIDATIPLAPADPGTGAPVNSGEQPQGDASTVMDALQIAGAADPADAQFFDDAENTYVGYVMVRYSESGEWDAPIWDNGVKTERKIPYHFVRYTTHNFKKDGTVVTIEIQQFDEAEQAEHYYSGGMMGTLNGSRHYEELGSYQVNNIQEEAERLVSMAERDNLLVWTSFVLN
jgi:predicted small lipoprotein YifL